MRLIKCYRTKKYYSSYINALPPRTSRTIYFCIVIVNITNSHEFTRLFIVDL